jgi:hypothetical protein
VIQLSAIPLSGLVLGLPLSTAQLWGAAADTVAVSALEISSLPSKVSMLHVKATMSLQYARSVEKHSCAVPFASPSVN